MGKCRCCGAETKNGYKICRTCYDEGMSRPCHGCTAETGRKIGCQDRCERKLRQGRAYEVIKALQRESKEFF